MKLILHRIAVHVLRALIVGMYVISIQGYGTSPWLVVAGSLPIYSVSCYLAELTNKLFEPRINPRSDWLLIVTMKNVMTLVPVVMWAIPFLTHDWPGLLRPVIAMITGMSLGLYCLFIVPVRQVKRVDSLGTCIRGFVLAGMALLAGAEVILTFR